MQIQYWFELFGTCFFAISGALNASERANSDWFSVTFIGFLTALGGGSLRDVLLGSYPIAWIKDPNLIYSVLVGIFMAYIFYNPFMKLRKTFILFDTLGIALFTIVGVEKAISLGVGDFTAAIMGMFTAVMGGVLRDILTNEIPVLFHKEIYSSACLTGALLYVVMFNLNAERSITFFTTGAFIIVFRLAALRYHWTLPKFRKSS